MEQDYSEILNIFDCTDEEKGSLLEYSTKVVEGLYAKEKKRLDAVLKNPDCPGDPAADYQTLANGYVHISFTMGYVFGQMFDICDEEAEDAVEELKQRLIGEGIFKYWPRDKVKNAAKVLKVYKKLEELTDFIENEFDLSKE